jgi:hypothetical protein
MALALARRSGFTAAAPTLLCIFIVSGGWLVLRSLPGFSFVRFPFAWAMIAQFPFAWAAAVGTDTVLSAASERGARRAVILGFVVAGGLGASVYSVVRALNLKDSAGVPEVISTLPSAALGVLGSLLIVVFAVAAWRGRVRESLLWAAALVLTLSHLSSYPFRYAPAAIARPSAQGKVRTLVGSALAVKGRALSVEDVLYGYNLTDRIPSLFGIEESFLPWRYREIIMRVRFLAIFRYIDWPILLSSRGFLDAMNLEYIAASPTERELFQRYGLQQLRQIGPDVLYWNPTRMGAAWVNYTARVLPSERAVRDYVLGNRFDPRIEVVLERPPKRAYPAVAEYLASPIKGERRPSPTELEIDVELPRPGILVVSDSAYPGWHAEVDGQPADWVRANYVLRGVELGPGSHRVRFFYRSSAFQWGLVLSGVGILVGIGLWLISLRQKNWTRGA